MFDGRLTRLAILVLLLLAPMAQGATPSPNRTNADGTDGQDITDLGVDPTGQFVAAVVQFDSAKVTNGGPLGTIPGSSPHQDVYICDYGTSERPTSGTGCRGARHASTIIPATETTNLAQHVAATSNTGSGSQGYFAVAGPGKWVSLWKATTSVPDWTMGSGDNYHALNVTISPDASKIIVGTAHPSPTAGGRVEVRFGNNGTLYWTLELKNLDGADVRPTSLKHSRTGNVLAIGTTDQILFTDPSSTKPSANLAGLQQVDAVNDIALSADGKYVAVAASNGVFLATLARESGRVIVLNSSVFNRGFGEPAHEVAMSLDGSRFAAAAGNKIHFFRRLDTSQVAEPAGDAFDAGARVSDLAYDEKAQLLVATAGNRVMGFGPNRNTPIFNFDATTSAFGGVDGPLRRVAVSDDAQRIILAGKTKTMAYSNVIAVNATLTTSSGAVAIQPTQTLPLSLTVKNAGSLADNYTFSVVTPVGWQSASAENVRLDPEESRTVIFNVTAPAGAEPGVYGVQARVRSQATDDLAARRNQASNYVAGPSVNLTIARSVVLKVEAPDEPIDLPRGGDQTVAIVIRNEGNAEGVVNLSVRQDVTPAWDVRFTPADQVRIPARGSVNVNMLVRAPPEAASGDRSIITIRAREGDSVEATDQVIAYADAEFGAELRTNKTQWDFYSGQTQIITLNITNVGNTEDTYNVTYAISPTTAQSDWRVNLEATQITIGRGETKRIAVTVKAVATDEGEATLTVKTTSHSPQRTENRVDLSLSTIPRPPTEEEDGNIIPTPGTFAALAALALVALAARRHAGGKR